MGGIFGAPRACGTKRMRALLFFLGILLLLVPEILRVYYIMPFPGSQEDVATDLRQLDIAYWLHTNIWWIRLIGLVFIMGPLIHYLRNGNWWKRIAVLLPVMICALVFYAFNFKFMADKMFYPPKEKVMRPHPQPLSQGEGGNALAIVVERNGDARAYPIELIGYHHQVLDTIGGEAVLVTYCTVCRTGRAWKPEVNGQPENFRLVGMDHFNAMFEDSRTGSWWRQATGECIVGPLKGQQLEEVPSEQLSIAEFASRHPKGLVFQPDPSYTEQYAELEGYDDGTIESGLEYRDTASWQMKSWVVGVVHNGHVRAYDWNALKQLGGITDTLGGTSIYLIAPPHSNDLLVWGKLLEPVDFMTNPAVQEVYSVVDNWYAPALFHVGDSTKVVIGTRIPAYQEFWHSWRTFHPNTTRYEPKR